MNYLEQLYNQTLPVDNQYVSTGLALGLVLYSGYVAPQLPASVTGMMDNVLVKLALFVGLIVVSNNNPTLALVAAVAVLTTLQQIERQRMVNYLMNSMRKEEKRTRRVMNNPDLVQRDADELEEDSDSQDPEMDSQPEMVVSESCPEMNYRDNFYPQYVDALPTSQTHGSRNVGMPEHNDAEPHYAQV